MKILAFDTTLGACSAAVFDSAANRVLASEFAAMQRGHAEALRPVRGIDGHGETGGAEAALRGMVRRKRPDHGVR